MAVTLESIANRFQNARRSGVGFVATCPAHEDRNPSLSIYMKPSGWIGLKCYTGCTERDVIGKAGLTNKDLAPANILSGQARGPDNKFERAEKLWGEAVQAIGTPVDRYLRGRGITSGFDNVRYHSGVPVTESDRESGQPPHPAALFRADNGAVQAVFLSGDAQAKYLNAPKKSHGPYSGHAVVFQEGEGPLILAEGPETALSVVSAGAPGTVAAVLGASNFRSVGVNTTAKTVLVVGDGDADDSPARESLRDAARAITAAGKTVHVLELPPNGEDLNDILQRAGPKEVLRLVEQALATPWVDPAPDRTGAQAGAHLGGAGETSTSSPTKLTAVSFRRVNPDLKRPHLVKGWIDHATLNLLFGTSNTGKSFFALYLALCIAMGWRWFGRRVQRGAVVYLAAESPGSIARRVVAMRQYFDLADRDVPLWIVPHAVDLVQDDQDLAALVSMIARLPNPVPVALVIVDTLAASMAGADENSFVSMSRLVARLIELRDRVRAAVLVVHHAGKDTERGARGHSSLRAAVDSEVELRQEEQGRIATITKARDGQTGDRVGFDLQPILLGVDADGEDVRVPVLVPLTADQVRQPPKGNDGEVLAVLAKLCTTSPSGVDEKFWREEFIRTAIASGRMNSDSARDVFRRALKKLVPTWAVVGGGRALLAPARQRPDKPESTTNPGHDRADSGPTSGFCRADTREPTDVISDHQSGPRQTADSRGSAPGAAPDTSDNDPTADSCRPGNPRPTLPTPPYRGVGLSAEPEGQQGVLRALAPTPPARGGLHPAGAATPAPTHPIDALAQGPEAPPRPVLRRTGVV